jgi:DNA (cytosine-5)-methyltransferase 1
MTLTATDLFCGAGGSSLGAETAGVRLAMGANHWPKAIEVHQENFPDAGHDCADISQVDPRRYPRTDILLASPECTNHSSAKGVSRKAQNPNLFDSPDLGAERSRATMWDVPRFVEAHRYDAVVVENVVDAARWIYWPSWWQAWDDAGYDARVLSINSAHTGDVHQWRDRIYVVAVRRGIAKVDLDIRPPSWCARCETTVAGVQSFKRPNARVGKWRQQYHYRCPTCSEIVAPPAPPAAGIIDWTLPAGRIGDRKRPLADATLRRIRLGLERYGAALVAGAGNTWERPGSEYARAWPLDQPTPAQSCSVQHAVAHPPAFMVQPHHQGSDSSRIRDVDAPVWACTASNDVAALVVPLRRNGQARPDREPVPTVAAAGTHHGLLMAPQSDGRAMSTDRPAPSLTAKVPPMLVPYNRSGIGRPVTEPSGTLTTKDRAALVDVDVDLDDCRFRMLEPHEVKAAMAFPTTYEARGTKTELVKLWGNAVTPPVMTMIVNRIVAALA